MVLRYSTVRALCLTTVIVTVSSFTDITVNPLLPGLDRKSSVLGVLSDQILINGTLIIDGIGTPNACSDRQLSYVDLGKVLHINGVVIKNRQDCCAQQFKDFYVELFAQNPKSFPDATAVVCHRYNGTMAVGATQILRCDPPSNGRYVRARNSAKVILPLCELQAICDTDLVLMGAPSNMALRKQSSMSDRQSGKAWGFATEIAARVVDGLIDQDCSSQFLRGSSNYQCFTVDLGSILNIYGVSIEIPSTSACPQDFNFLVGNSYCYHISNDTKTFQDAKALCQELGGKLAEPKTMIAYNALRDKLRTSGAVGYFIGGNDLQTEGSWVFDSDKSKLDIPDRNGTLWRNGDPFNGAGGADTQDCLEFSKDADYKFDDMQCDTARNYVCQVGIGFSSEEGYQVRVEAYLDFPGYTFCEQENAIHCTTVTDSAKLYVDKFLDLSCGTVPIVARYVRVRVAERYASNRKKLFDLCELFVWAIPYKSNFVNVALDKPAVMSSVADLTSNALDFNASTAVDGLSGVGTLWSCAVSGGNSPWWQVDLLQDYTIYGVILTGVLPKFPDDGISLRVDVLDGAGTQNVSTTCVSVDRDDLRGFGFMTIVLPDNMGLVTTRQFPCPGWLSGKYVRISQSGNKPLVLCEVQVLTITTEPTCGGMLTQTVGVIASPNYPDAFPPGIVCQWQSVATSDGDMLIVLSDYDVGEADGGATCRTIEDITFFNSTGDVVFRSCGQARKSISFGNVVPPQDQIVLKFPQKASDSVSIQLRTSNERSLFKRGFYLTYLFSKPGSLFDSSVFAVKTSGQAELRQMTGVPFARGNKENTRFAERWFFVAPMAGKFSLRFHSSVVKEVVCKHSLDRVDVYYPSTDERGRGVQTSYTSQCPDYPNIIKNVTVARFQAIILVLTVEEEGTRADKKYEVIFAPDSYFPPSKTCNDSANNCQQMAAQVGCRKLPLKSLQQCMRTCDICNAEVRTADLVNGAKYKVADQSTSIINGNARYATDGNKNTSFSSLTCSHTGERDFGPWWSVDLTWTVDVYGVVITNRGDCCGERLKDFKVEVLADSPRTNGAITLPCLQYSGSMPSGATEKLMCTTVQRGQYVKISLPSNLANLSLCEVEVLVPGRDDNDDISIGHVHTVTYIANNTAQMNDKLVLVSSPRETTMLRVRLFYDFTQTSVACGASFVQFGLVASQTWTFCTDSFALSVPLIAPHSVLFVRFVTDDRLITTAGIDKAKGYISITFQYMQPPAQTLNVSGKAVQILDVALYKPASMSYKLEGFGWEASYAVDGTVTGPDHSTCSSTYLSWHDRNRTQWWYVDLLSTYTVFQVSLTNMKDCCADRLTNFTIKVFQDNPKREDSQYSVCAHYTPQMTKGETRLFDCTLLHPSGIEGRYVLVELWNSLGLYLCDVKVFAAACHLLKNDDSVYEGYILSPGYPLKFYGSGMQCDWQITAPVDGFVSLQPGEGYQPPDSCERLYVLGSAGAARSGAMDLISLPDDLGAEFTYDVQKGDTVIVNFTASLTTGQTVFFLYYHFHGACDNVKLGNKGTVSSPGYPSLDYPLGADCTWTLSVTETTHVFMTLLDIDISGVDECLRTGFSRVECPAEFSLRRESTCFYVSEQSARNLSEARKTCKLLGGKLVEPTEAVNSFLVDKLRTKSGRYMIGLRKIDGRWKFISNSQAVSWFEPTFAKLKNDSSVNNCVTFDRVSYPSGLSDYSWRQHSCEEEALFICEKENACPPAFPLRFNTSCYALNTSLNVTYDDAKKHCQSLGGKLAEPRTDDANRFLEQVLLTNEESKRIYIGATNSDDGRDQVWRWDSGTRPFITNQYWGLMDKDFDYKKHWCLQFFLQRDGNYRWDYALCDSRAAVLCETPIVCGEDYLEIQNERFTNADVGVSKSYTFDQKWVVTFKSEEGHYPKSGTRPKVGRGFLLNFTVITDCPADFPMKHEKLCFYASADEVTFSQAKEACSRKQGILAEPRTPAVFQYLLDYSNYKFWNITIGVLRNAAKGGQFAYISDNSTNLLQNTWADNNTASRQPGDCVHFRVSFTETHLWRPYSCSDKSHYYCQLAQDSIFCLEPFKLGTLQWIDVRSVPGYHCIWRTELNSVSLVTFLTDASLPNNPPALADGRCRDVLRLTLFLPGNWSAASEMYDLCQAGNSFQIKKHYPPGTLISLEIRGGTTAYRFRLGYSVQEGSGQWNIALGAKVLETVQVSGYKAQAVVDGLLDTCVCNTTSTGCNAPGQRSGVYMVLDLGAPYDVSSIEVFNAFANASFSSCPPGFPLSYQSTLCFYIATEKARNFTAAKEKCRLMGGKLAEPSSKDVSDFLISKLQVTYNVQAMSGYYIGVLRLVSSWKFDSQPYMNVFTDFRAGEPNNIGGFENCVATYLNRYSDVNCTDERPYICQAYPSVRAVCPPEFRFAYGDRCYHLSPDEKDYEDAQARCKQMGGKLAELRSLDAYTFITQHRDLHAVSQFFIGATDIQTEGTFVYDSDHMNLTFPDNKDNVSLWWPKKPSEEHGGGNQDCLEFWQKNSTFKLDDENCEVAQHYLCEADFRLPAVFISAHSHTGSYDQDCKLSTIRDSSAVYTCGRGVARGRMVSLNRHIMNLCEVKVNGRPVCPEEYSLSFGAHCYHISADAKTASDAQARCRQMGGKLAEPRTLAAVTFLRLHVSYDSRTVRNYFIGANDRQKEGTFVYDSDSSKVTFPDNKDNVSLWWPGEPSEENGGGKQDCLELWKRDPNATTLAFGDVECDVAHYYICEAETTCPPDFTGFLSHCYYISDDKQSEDYVQASCAELGAKLAEPKTEETDKYIRDQAHAARVEWLFIGVIYIEKEGTFVYDSDHSPLAVRGVLGNLTSPWAPGDPKPISGRFCVGMWIEDNYAWRSVDCHVSIRYVCEIPNAYASVITRYIDWGETDTITYPADRRYYHNHADVTWHIYFPVGATVEFTFDLDTDTDADPRQLLTCQNNYLSIAGTRYCGPIVHHRMTALLHENPLVVKFITAHQNDYTFRGFTLQYTTNGALMCHQCERRNVSFEEAMVCVNNLNIGRCPVGEACSFWAQSSYSSFTNKMRTSFMFGCQPHWWCGRDNIPDEYRHTRTKVLGLQHDDQYTRRLHKSCCYASLCNFEAGKSATGNGGTSLNYVWDAPDLPFKRQVAVTSP